MMGSYADKREMTIQERLADERILFLWGAINSGLAGDLIMRMLEMQHKDATRDINLYINSPGGYVDATLAIYDTMQYLTCDVATICVGGASSGAAVILLAGAKGKRCALPNSKVMLHQPLGGITGQASDIKIQAETIIKDKKKLNQIIANHTGRTYEEIAETLERDHFMDPEEAKAFGIIDSIVTKVQK